MVQPSSTASCSFEASAASAAAVFLAAASCTICFADDMSTASAHVVFPADGPGFAEATRLGAAIVALETIARRAEPRFRTARPESKSAGTVLDQPRIGSAFLRDAEEADVGAIPITESSAGRMKGVRPRVFAFDVLGYRVLDAWLTPEEREALRADFAKATKELPG